MSDADERRRYELLLRAGRLFNEVLELSALLVAVRDFVQEAVSARALSLLWLDPGAESGRYLILWNEIQFEAPTVVDPLERRFVKDVIADHRPLLLADLSRRPDFTPRYSRALGVELGPAAVVPLIRGGKLRGVLEVARRPGDAAFDVGTSELLQALGEDIVVSVSNAYLYDEVRRVSEENRLLSTISADLGRALDIEELLDRLLDDLARIVPYDAAGIYLRRRESEGIEWLEHRGYPGGADEPLQLKLGVGIVGQVAASGTPEIVGDVRGHPHYVRARESTRSEMVVPIRSGGSQVIGAFNVESDHEHAFGERDRERLEAFAAVAGVAIEREWVRRLRQDKERLDRELAVARKIQEAFLPRSMPILPGFELWGAQRPSIEMSGDYYDVITISKRDFGLVMADVSGKGVPAALIMASLRAGLISEVRNVYAIREVIGRVNQFLVDSTDPQDFATMFYGVLNTADLSLTFVNAGHDPPLWVRPGRGARWLSTGGTILGSFAGVTYREERITLQSGDIIVLYTDGLTESRNERGEFFDPERLMEVVTASIAAPARQIGEALLAAVDTFSGEEPRDDDQTLLILRVP